MLLPVSIRIAVCQIHPVIIMGKVYGECESVAVTVFLVKHRLIPVVPEGENHQFEEHFYQTINDIKLPYITTNSAPTNEMAFCLNFRVKH